MATAIPSHLLSELHWKEQVTPELLSTGVDSIDLAIEGCPRGRITEIVGSTSSGRTTLLLSILAEASRLGEYTALVDTTHAFDPPSAAAAGIALDRLVWIRCNGSVEHAMRAADLLIHAGGFGVIALDLADAPAPMLRRIPVSSWYRFRRAIEPTPCALVLLNREPQAKACATLMLEMKRSRSGFEGTKPVLEEAAFQVMSRKPVHPRPTAFEAAALTVE